MGDRISRTATDAIPRVPPTNPDLDGCSDQELMEAIVGDGSRALGVLLSRHWKPLVSFVFGFVGRRDVAEDVVQETFVRVWQRRGRWQATGSVRSFLYRIARNLALNENRASQTRARGGISLTTDRTDRDPAQLLEEHDLRDAVEAAISALPERRREIFVLSRYHGLSYREIAETLDISPQTVANQLSAALATLRESLASYRAP